MFDPRTLAKIERTLQYNIVLLVALSAIVLALGQSNGFAIAVLSVGAPVTCLVVDRLQWFALPRAIANVAMIVVMIFSLGNFFDKDTTDQMLSISNVLIYLQLIFLLQRKSERLYWHLIVLSLLQIVVGTALNVSPGFLPLIMTYAVVAISCLTVFYVYRESLRAARQHDGQLRLPRSSIDDSTWSRHLRRMIASIAVIALIFSQAFFFVAPNSRGSMWNQRSSGNAQVGFANKVTLSERGKHRLSNAVVMRTYFEDSVTGANYEVYSEPYLFGAVLARYRWDETRQGVWEPEIKRGNRMQRVLPSFQANVPRRDAVRMRVAQVPQPQRNLFVVHPTYLDLDAPENEQLDVRTDHRTQEVYVQDLGENRYRGRMLHYVLISNGFRDGIQLPLTPHVQITARGRSEGIGVLSPSRRALYLKFDEQKMPGLKRLSQKVLGQAPGQQSSRLFTARALSNYFRSSGEFKYTLDFSRLHRLRDKRVDPLEDFVTSHKQGDCRFYAGALVMMLRSQGIPARMVVGFKAGEYNALGEFYMVRQKHAHAWVEAYLEPNDIPEGVLKSNERWQGGAWLRLDPTPPEEVESTMLSSTGGLILRIRQMMNYVEALWQDFLGRGGTASMNRRRAGDARTVNNPWSLKSLLERFTRWFRTAVGFAFGLVIIVAVGLAIFVIARRWRQRQATVESVTSQSRSRARIDFFERLEAILRRHEMERPAHRTAREHAEKLRPVLTELDDQLNVVLNKVIAAYYQVRFGSQDLDNEQRETIQLALSQLDAALASDEIGPSS